MNEIYIKVSTDQLIAASGEVENKIQTLEKALRDIESVITSSSKYWEGDGNVSYRKTFQAKTDRIQKAFVRFRENVTDLKIIAGVYVDTEVKLTEINASLPTDQIL